MDKQADFLLCKVNFRRHTCRMARKFNDAGRKINRLDSDFACEDMFLLFFIKYLMMKHIIVGDGQRLLQPGNFRRRTIKNADAYTQGIRLAVN